MIKTLVLNWLVAGAPFAEGARLFSDTAGPQHPFNIFLEKKSKAAYFALKITLCRRAGISQADAVKAAFPKVPAPVISQPVKKITLPVVETPTPKLREDWPFLNDPTCPPELKILAANKITAYHEYTAAHAALFNCSNINEQLQAVKRCVENYIENRRIIAEFKYYKQHGNVLGKHPIFKSFLQIKALRKLNVIQLLKRKEQLTHSIWRQQAEIKKGDKPHLQLEREARMQEKKNELAEVERILQEYE